MIWKFRLSTQLVRHGDTAMLSPSLSCFGERRGVCVCWIWRESLSIKPRINAPSKFWNLGVHTVKGCRGGCVERGLAHAGRWTNVNDFVFQIPHNGAQTMHSVNGMPPMESPFRNFASITFSSSLTYNQKSDILLTLLMLLCYVNGLSVCYFFCRSIQMVENSSWWQVIRRL